MNFLFFKCHEFSFLNVTNFEIYVFVSPFFVFFFKAVVELKSAALIF